MNAADEHPGSEAGGDDQQGHEHGSRHCSARLHSRAAADNRGCKTLPLVPWLRLCCRYFAQSRASYPACPCEPHRVAPLGPSAAVRTHPEPPPLGGRIGGRVTPKTRTAATVRCGRKCRFHRHFGVGGAERDRTADLLIANEALSQLSYGPDRGRTASLPRPAASGRHLRPAVGRVKNRGKAGALRCRLV